MPVFEIIVVIPHIIAAIHEIIAVYFWYFPVPAFSIYPDCRTDLIRPFF